MRMSVGIIFTDRDNCQFRHTGLKKLEGSSIPRTMMRYFDIVNQLYLVFCQNFLNNFGPDIARKKSLEIPKFKIVDGRIVV